MPDQNPSLEQILLQKASSIGPDTQREAMQDRSQWMMGALPPPGQLGVNPKEIQAAAETLGGSYQHPDEMSLLGHKIQNLMDRFGPDWVGALQKLYGTPKSLVQTPQGGTVRAGRKIADLLLTKALGTAYDHLPPSQDILPSIVNHFLPPGQHYPLSTEPKKP